MGNASDPPASQSAAPSAAASAPLTGPPPDTDEVDLWWGTYAGRTMLPVFLVGVLLTLGILALRVLASVYRVPLPYPRLLTDVLLAAVWLVPLARWAHRVLATNYRLTTERLLWERAFHMPSEGGVALERILQVVVVRSPAERLLRVARIRVVIADRERPLILEGVSDPDHVALMIRNQVQQARAQQTHAAAGGTLAIG